MPVKFFATLPKKQKKTIYETIKENAAGNASYVFVVILGAVVATLGLLTSNIAVINRRNADIAHHEPVDQPFFFYCYRRFGFVREIFQDAAAGRVPCARG